MYRAVHPDSLHVNPITVFFLILELEAKVEVNFARKIFTSIKVAAKLGFDVMQYRFYASSEGAAEGSEESIVILEWHQKQTSDMIFSNVPAPS